MIVSAPCERGDHENCDQLRDCICLCHLLDPAQRGDRQW